MNTNSSMTIKEAAEFLGIDAQYVRKLIHEKKLVAKLEPIAGTEVQRWTIDRKSIEDRKNRTSTSSRSDGRNKFVLYATKEELDRLNKIVAEAGLNLPISRANSEVDVAKRVAKARQKRLEIRNQKKADLKALKSNG